MITDYVPAAYVTHDMLHMRGGHQVEWLIDGVPIPNTNIAANLAPTIDPKDIDYLEVQRGSYGAAFGDRTYGVFNIVPRTGFERNNECDLAVTFGSYYQTNDQINCGSHTQRFAYYISLNGNRSDYGLQTPINLIFHDAENGYGGFGSLIFNPDPKNQLRLVASLRKDYYQIPYDPDPNSFDNQQYPSYGLRDGEHESDGYVTFSWVHTFSPNALLTISPFYHYNSADYQGGANDFPVISTNNQVASYGGAQATLDEHFWRNDAQLGVYAFGQHQYDLFENEFTDGSENFPASSIGVNGGLGADIRRRQVQTDLVADLYRRPSRNALYSGRRRGCHGPSLWRGRQSSPPTLGFSRLLRGLLPSPASGDGHRPGQRLSDQPGFSFAPLHGERDEEHQYGVTIPYRGWDLDADTYQTRARNWLDHNNIGESNLFWPITWDAALDSRLGTDTTFPAAVESRPVSPRLCESIRAGNRTYHRRLGLPSAAGILTGRSRSEKHAEPGLQWEDFHGR